LGVCILPDGSECDEWTYFRGECSPASQGGSLPTPTPLYCEQQGYTLEIHIAEDGSQTGVCVFPDGSECDELAYYHGECSPASQGGSLPNPASVYCEQQGYSLEVRTASDGSQLGDCIFPDGSECDEWAYYRHECKPSSSASSTETSEYDNQGWKIYRDEALGYSFHYPADALISIDDEPKKSLSITGPGLGSEFWGIAHPIDRPEYPSEDVDLLQWLAVTLWVKTRCRMSKLPGRSPSTFATSAAAIL
jgi:putative hemolysin